MNKISVIIPAFNEEEYIGETLSALKGSDLEIILVDNGSTDRTIEIAHQQGVKVVEFPIGTIAAVRNRGVKESSGEILVFIDSDVRVTSGWHKKLSTVIEELKKSPNVVTGSRYKSPGNQSVLNKYWYTQLTQYEANYINAGHLIVTRELFNKIQGFSENLETAEDYDFCKKAILAGAVIRDNSELVVTHDGYPQSLTSFLQRERWHGRQDVENWQSFLDSKIAWFAGLNLVLFLVALLVTFTGTLLAFPVYLILMYIVSFMLTIYKFGFKKINYMLIMPAIFYCYLCGRSLAIVDRFTGRKQK